LKLFGRDKNKDKDNEEKPIVFYYAKQIGVLGTNISLPIEEDAYVYLYEDRIDVKLLKRESRTVIPYKSMTDLQNMDAGNKVDIERVVGLGVIPGLLWKKHHVVTVIKYTDDASVPQIMALDFRDDTKYAQPLIYKKMREKQQHSQISDQLSKPTQETNQPATTSIADELSKLVKLKEQGVITEEEFLQMKNNLIKGSK
jgi:hypothetical protein